MCQAITAYGPSRHSFSDMGIEDIPCGIPNSYEKIKLGGGLSRLAKESGAFRGELTKSNDLAAIFHFWFDGTSKGVCYEQGMFEAQVIALGRQYGIEEGEVDCLCSLYSPYSIRLWV